MKIRGRRRMVTATRVERFPSVPQGRRAWLTSDNSPPWHDAIQRPRTFHRIEMPPRGEHDLRPGCLQLPHGESIGSADLAIAPQQRAIQVDGRQLEPVSQFTSNHARILRHPDYNSNGIIAYHPRNQKL